jgi:hypothetical protein
MQSQEKFFNLWIIQRIKKGKYKEIHCSLPNRQIIKCKPKYGSVRCGPSADGPLKTPSKTPAGRIRLLI